MEQRLRSKHFYFSAPLSAGAVLLSRPLARRLSRVLRYKPGQELVLFNGQDGAWHGTFDGVETVNLTAQATPQPAAPEVTLYIGLLKRENMDLVLRQATECGVTTIQPLLTEFTVPTKLNTERAEALLVEAAEQCERLSLPQLKAPVAFKSILKEACTIWWADEAAAGTAGKWGSSVTRSGEGVLIGPEGGFSPAEQEHLRAANHIKPVGLGRNILRADTAVPYALSRFFEYLS